MAITAAQLDVRIRTDGADRAKRDLNDLGNAVDKTGERSRMLGGGLLGLGGVITGLFAGATNQAIGFGEQMANVNSIAQVTSEELAGISQQVLDLASASGQAPETLAAGLYDIYSSGFQGAEGLQVLEASANAANAGLTDTATSAKAITAVLNAYGMSAAEAGHVSDVLFQTVNDGVITFEQLATNMGNTLPIANALGVSFEELGAAYARMTLAGVQPSQAETQIAALMRAAINPTKELTAAVVEFTDYATVEELVQNEGMVGYLQLLDKASGGSKEKLFALLGTTEAVNAALLLGGDNLDAYNAELEKMQKSSEGLGATQKALAKQMESTAFSLRLLKTNIQAAAIAIGVQFEPAIKVIANAMTGLIKMFLNLPEPVQRVIAVVTALIGALAAGAGAWILFGSQISAAAGLFLSMLGPIGLVIAAVGALYVAYKKNWGGVGTVFDKVFGRIQDGFKWLSGFADRFRKAWDLLTAPVNQMADMAGGVLDGANAIADSLGAIERPINAIRDLVDGVNQPLGELSGIVDGIASAVNGDGSNSGLTGAIGNLAAMGSIQDDLAQMTGPLGFFEKAMLSLSAAMSGSGVGWVDALADSLGRLAVAYNTGGLGGLAAQIGTELADLAAYLGQQLVIAIPRVIVNIAQWAMGQIPDLWEQVKSWALGGSGAGQGRGLPGEPRAGAGMGGSIPLGMVAVEIGGWLVTAAETIWDAIKRTFSFGGGGSGYADMGNGQMVATSGGQEPIDYGTLSIHIGAFDVDIDFGAMYESINSKFEEATTVSDADLAGIEAKGQEWGRSAMTALISGIQAIFSGGGMADMGSGEGVSTSATGNVALSRAVRALIKGLFTGAGDVIKEELNAAGAEIESAIRGAAGDLWNRITGAIQGIFSGGGSPYGSGAGGYFGQPMAGGTLSGWLSDLLTFDLPDWSIDIPMPDINWPDPPSLDSVPDWVKDPVGWVQDQLTGGGQQSGPKAIPQQGGGGGGYGEELPYGNSIALPAVDTTAFVASLETARSSYNAFVADIAGGMGGGARGAAGGAAGPSGFALPPLNTSAFTASLQQAQATATAAMGQIRGVVTAGTAQMAGAMVSGMATFRGAVTSGMASAVGAVRAGIAAMVAAASAGRGMMMSAGLGIGAALGQGIAAGIRGQIGAVAAAAAALVTSAVAAARNAGAIHSPSEVMRSQVGLMLGAGVEAGILDSISDIQRAAGQMVPSLNGSPGGVRAGVQGGGVTYVVNVTVEGNVTTENDLTASIARAVGLGIVNDQQRYRTSVLGSAV